MSCQENIFLSLEMLKTATMKEKKGKEYKTLWKSEGFKVDVTSDKRRRRDFPHYHLCSSQDAAS